jgi:hypothetical protein
VIRAIVLHIGTLRHPNASAADKAEALKFLGHFVCQPASNKGLSLNLCGRSIAETRSMLGWRRDG